MMSKSSMLATTSQGLHQRGKEKKRERKRRKEKQKKKEEKERKKREGKEEKKKREEKEKKNGKGRKGKKKNRMEREKYIIYQTSFFIQLNSELQLQNFLWLITGFQKIFLKYFFLKIPKLIN